MAEPTGDSAFWTAIGAAGVFLGSVIAAIFGARKKAEPAVADEATTELAELRAKLGLQEIRRDLEDIFRAHREAIDTHLRSFETAIHTKIDGLSEERRSDVADLEKRLRRVELDGARRDGPRQ